SAGFGVVLLGAVAAALFIQQQVTPISLGVIGPFSVIAPILYFLAMRSVFFFERREEDGEYVAKLTEARKLAGEAVADGLSWIYLVFAVNAVVL
ncbi:MAG: hypothetical protein GWN58_16190, partial [Anaerolineae bacterium]|nr:hypothetical protein [Anaerolineae bacterium]